MKLYEFLFEDESPAEKPKQTNSFTAPRFAVAHITDSIENETFILYDTVKLKELIEWNPKGGDFWVALAGTITVRPSDEGCLGAMQVAYVASSEKPEYKGAGGLMYAIASKHTDAPYTSDRDSSTSKSARKKWDKMIANGNLQKIQALDNYVLTQQGSKEYVQINPDRTHQVLNGPATSTEYDDCKLPGGKGWPVSKSVGLTGTPDIWRTTVPVNLAPLLARHEQFVNETGLTESQLAAASDDLFHNRYKGSQG
jgi:hypothetical protein